MRKVSEVQQKSVNISQWVNEQKVPFPAGGRSPQQCAQLGEWSLGQSSASPGPASSGNTQSLLLCLGP